MVIHSARYPRLLLVGRPVHKTPVESPEESRSPPRIPARNRRDSDS